MKLVKLILFTLLAIALAGSASPITSSGDALDTVGARETREAQKKKKARGDNFKKECLSAHNKWRREHGAPELKLDPKLTSYAQARADFIAATDKFEHLKDSPYGENLAWHTDLESSCTKLSGLWYEEIAEYDFAKPAYNASTGHFTQMIWRDTSRVGCARQLSSGAQGGVYLVCNYDPPGNFLGEFRENVLPAGSAKRPPTAAAAAATTKAPSASTERAISVTSTELTFATAPATTERPPTTKPKSSNKKKNKKKKKNNNKKKKKNGNKRKKGNKKNNSTTEANHSAPITTTLRPLL